MLYSYIKKKIFLNLFLLYAGGPAAKRPSAPNDAEKKVVTTFRLIVSLKIIVKTFLCLFKKYFIYLFN